MVSARTDDANAAVYNPLTLIAKGWLSPAPGVTDRIFADMINNVISGRENVQQALKAADDSLGSAVAR
jgi:ABC-type glycerol-3-phosphate transport system substrate-binding protein